MQQRAMAHLSVPVVGMGTSGTLDLPDDQLALAAAITDAALDSGSTLIDTSPMYGRAEAVLCRALAERRPQALIATKVWTADDEEAERQITTSLAYFGGHVELFQIHNLVGWRTRLDQLERRRDQGQVTLIGATHWRAQAYPELEEVMRTDRLDAIQVPYNPLEQRVSERVLPLAADLGLGVLVMRPLGGGGLSDAAPTGKDLAPLRAAGLTSWSQALLAWALSDPRVSSVIPASSQPAHVADNARAGSLPALDPAVRHEIERLATRPRS
ncbi:MAG TPA: aldo/keto reductase [Euzebya sp.]|nr:aldo/keto reductase [Euzebya sp.]